MQERSDLAGATCRTPFRIIARKMEKQEHTCGSAGCEASAMYFMRTRSIRSRMSLRTRPEKIHVTTCWRYLVLTGSFRGPSCRKITQTMMATTRNTRSIRRDSGAYSKLPPKKPDGAKRKMEMDLEWDWQFIAAF